MPLHKVSLTGVIKSFSRVAIFVSVLMAGWSAVIYVTAPVERLRRSVTYTPPSQTYTQEVGLGFPGHLTISEMPIHLILATLVNEDREFHTHYGFRPQKILNKIKYAYEHGEPVRGISSITQQIAKNVFTGPERSLYRKYIELLYAVKMEQEYTKEELFTLYANLAQTGKDLYGYSAASRAYFRKEVRDLTVAEAAFILSLLPNPVRYAQPFIARALDNNTQRRMHYTIARVLMFTHEILPQGITAEEKEYFFTRYLPSKGAIFHWRTPSTSFLREGEALIEEFRVQYQLR